MISEAYIYQIRNTAIINDVIGSRITLKRRNNDFIGLCPFHNEKSGSFTVNPVKGIYKCFGCGKAGDVIEFVKEFEKITFLEAVKVLANEYHLPIDELSKEYKKPLPLKDISGIDAKTLAWFKKRGISSATLQWRKVTTEKRFVPQAEEERTVICFNEFREDELINVHYRDGKKNFFAVAGAELIFYGLDFIKDELQCTITEGQIDCLSFHEIGVFSTVSVPNGASVSNGSLPYLDNCYEYFQNKVKIYLATDVDMPGLALREELARRLGKDRCWIVNYPNGCKDANDVLVKHGADALMDCWKTAIPYPIKGIMQVSDMSAQINNIYDNGYPKTDKIGFQNFDKLISWTLSQFTVITGLPGSGKSEFMDMVYIRLASRFGWKFGIFSAENKPNEYHFIKLAEKYIGRPFTGYGKMSSYEKEVAEDFIGKHFFFIDESEIDLTIEGLLEKARELVLQKGINSFVIDPWNRVEHNMPIGQSETMYISTELSRIYKFKDLNNLHFFIVAHPVKIKKEKNHETKKWEYLIPSLYDISGSANWFNKCDNGIVVYRIFDAEIQSNRTEVHVQKVRHRWLGRIGMAEFDYNVNNGLYREIGKDFEAEFKMDYPPEWDIK